MSSGSMARRGPAASARRAVAIWMGRAAAASASKLGGRSGTAIAGRVALAIDPRALSGLAAELPRGSIVVAGSAGHGTTCELLAQVIQAAGLGPVLASGDSASQQGVTAAMIAQARPTGHLHRPGAAIGIVAADLDAVTDVVRHAPGLAAIVCTNLVRDQRDRGLARPASATALERAIRLLPATTALILNADDPDVACLAPEAPNPRLYFGISDPAYGRRQADPAARYARCPQCDGELSYARTYYGHLGDWACGGCSLHRPEPEISATKVWMSGGPVTRLQLATTAGACTLEIPLPGLHNCYNSLAAVAAAIHLRLPASSLAAAAGCRPERIRVDGHDVYLSCVRNATDYTAVIRAILGAGEPRHMLLGLDDDPGQSPDPGWLWDVDFDSVAGLAPTPVLCGSRAADLAVRLKYAGWLGDTQDLGESVGAIIEPDVNRAVQAALATTPAGQQLWIVATPASASDLRRWLRRRAGRRDDTHHHAGTAAGRRPAGPHPTGPHPTGPHPTGPHPTGPGPSGPTPSGPPRDGRRPTSRSRIRRRHRQSAQHWSEQRGSERPGAGR